MRNHTRALLALLATTAVALAGCSSSGSGGGGGSSPAGPSSNPPAQQNQPAGGAASGGAASGGASTGGSTSGGFDMVSYVGGKAGKADSSLSPVTIGYINQQGGPVAVPLSSNAADAAVKYINQQLGGIDGHPVKLSSCYVISEESEGQKCGQQFANDPKISVIAMGGVFTGNGSFYKTINGKKPVIGSISSSPADLTAKNTYFLEGATTVGYGALVSYIKSKGAKSLVVALDNGPAGQLAVPITKAAAKKAGISVKFATFSVGSSNLVGPLVAAGAQKADVMALFGTPAECIQYAKAAKQLNISDKTTLAVPTCIDPSVKKALGDLPKWTYTISVNGNDLADPQVALFQKIYKQYEGDKASGGFAPTTFGVMMTVAKMLNAAGGADATPAQVTKSMKAFKGPVYLGLKTIDCGADPAAPSSCTEKSKIQTYAGDGKWVTNGYFAAP